MKITRTTSKTKTTRKTRTSTKETVRVGVTMSLSGVEP
jgi:hypothetical protein